MSTQEDKQITEDSLLQALSKIGAGKTGRKAEREEPDGALPVHVQASEPLRGHTIPYGNGGVYHTGGHSGGQNKRRRFVGDDSVVVERHALSRSQGRSSARSSVRDQQNRPHRPIVASHGDSGFMQDSGAKGRFGNVRGNKSEESQEIHHLRQNLRQEQGKLRDIEGEARDLRNKLKMAETRMAHYRLQLEELGRQLGVQQSETLRLRSELRQMRDGQAKPNKTGSQASPQAGRKRGRPRKQPVVISAIEVSAQTTQSSDEPEPVQWWTD